MRMALGRRADYAVRAAVWLARQPVDTPHKGKVIAEATGVPVQFLPQVLAGLVHAGIVGSTPGPRGGYRLTRSPEAISVLDVVEAVEGPTTPGLCPMRGEACAGDGTCGLHEHWRAAQQLARASLGAASLAGVAAAERGRGPGQERAS